MEELQDNLSLPTGPFTSLTITSNVYYELADDNLFLLKGGLDRDAKTLFCGDYGFKSENAQSDKYKYEIIINQHSLALCIYTENDTEKKDAYLKMVQFDADFTQASKYNVFNVQARIVHGFFKPHQAHLVVTY